ncbi:MAG: hypothetical protein ABIR80_02790 [Opitutaceae bacterium]
MGRVDNNDFLNVGRIQIGLGFGNAGNVTGTVTIADAKSTDPRGTDIDFDGVRIGTAGNATGKIGLITVTGKGEDTDFVFSGIIGANNLGGDIVEVSGLIVNSFEDIVLNGAIQGSKIGAIALNTIAGVGTADTNDGAGTGVATSVTLNGAIRADDGVPNQGETLGDLTINLGLTNSTITAAAGFQFGATDVLKGTGSKIGNIALTANAIASTATVPTASTGASIFAETIGNTTLTAGGGNIAWATSYNGLTIGNFTATAASNVTINGFIGSSGPASVTGFPPAYMGLPADRTESVGNFTLTSTSTGGSVTLGSGPIAPAALTSSVIADVIGTTTLTTKEGSVNFNANFFTAANAQSPATGAYGAISLASSVKGNINMNGSLSGAAGGDVTLTTLAGGTIGVTTTYLAGAGGKLTATAADGTITYNADVEGGSIGAASLTSSTKGNINYGALSTFAGTVGDVTIATKDVGTVTYNPVFGQKNLGAQASGSAGLVNITAEKGAVTIAPLYGDRLTSAGALTASTTEGTIGYGALSYGTVVALGAPPVQGTLITSAGVGVSGTESGSIGLVTLSTTGKDASITVTADIEATSFAGITATTTGTTSSANITFTDSDIWAQTVGNFNLTTAEGNVSVDAASSIRGFWNSNGGSVAVGDINLTATSKGLVTFNALVEATTNVTAANFTGNQTIGNSTFTGNTAGGGVAFGGQIQVGRFDAGTTFNGVFDQGTIGKITFNGNTTFTAATQFGIESAIGATGATLQPLQNGQQQNGQYTPGASAMGAFTVNGKLTAVGGTLANGLLRAAKLDSFTVTSDVTLIADGSNTAAGLIFVPQLGTVSFGGAAAILTATASAPVFVAHDIGGITFNSTQTNLNGGTVFLALDATSDLDTIGPINGTGRVVGNTVASNINFGLGVFPRGEIEGSSIGNVTITAVVDGSFVNNAVTNLDLRASNLRGNQSIDSDGVALGNQPGTHSITNEAITADGSNVQNFAIGNIAITANQTGAFTNTSVFGGTNSFVANGKLGNITLVGNINGTAQPSMFGTVGDSAWFTVGDGDAISNPAASGTDFDGNGLIVGTAELASDFTGGNVAVGNIFVNVDNLSHVLPPVEDFDTIGGAVGNQNDGLAILVGVQLNTNGTDGVGRGAAAALGLGSRIDAQLFGRVGSITFQNGQIANQANVVARSVITAAANTAGFGAVVAVAGDGSNLTSEIADLVNDVNPLGVVAMTDDPVAANSQVAVIGNTLAGAAVLPANQDRWDDGEVLVYVL